MIINLMSYLLILVPLALITGPFIPDLFVVISAFFIIYILIKKKNFNFLKLNFTKLFIFFYFIILISSFLSDNITVSLKSSIFYIRFFLFALCTYYICEYNNKFVKNFFSFIFLIFIVLIFDSIFQYLIGFNIIGFELFKQNEFYRSTSFFNTDLKLGSYLARLSPLFIYSFIFFSKLKNKYIFTFLMVAFSSSILLTGERTAIFLFILSLIFLSIFIKEKFLKSNLIFSIFFLIISSGLILTFNKNLKERIINQSTFQLFKYENKLVPFSYHHQAHYKASYEIFKDSPIFGAGPKSYRYESLKEKYLKNNKNAWSTHPHNTYFQLLAETGLFSFLLIIGLFLFFFINSIFQLFKIKIYFKNDLLVCTVCCFLISLWPIAPTGSFFNNWISIIYFLPIGFFWYGNQMNNEKII